MIYDHIEILLYNLQQFNAGLATPIDHAFVTSDKIADRGDKDEPALPYILVAPLQSQPGYPNPKPWNVDEPALSRGRLVISINSRLSKEDDSTQTIVRGYRGEHRSAVAMVSDFLLTNQSLTIPVEFAASYPDNLGLLRDSPQAGIPSTRNDRFRHEFFAITMATEVICPLSP